MGVYNSFEKMKPQLCFFLKKALVIELTYGNEAKQMQDSHGVDK